MLEFPTEINDEISGAEVLDIVQSAIDRAAGCETAACRGRRGGLGHLCARIAVERAGLRRRLGIARRPEELSECRVEQRFERGFVDRQATTMGTLRCAAAAEAGSEPSASAAATEVAAPITVHAGSRRASTSTLTSGVSVLGHDFMRASRNFVIRQQYRDLRLYMNDRLERLRNAAVSLSRLQGTDSATASYFFRLRAVHNEVTPVQTHRQLRHLVHPVSNTLVTFMSQDPYVHTAPVTCELPSQRIVARHRSRRPANDLSFDDPGRCATSLDVRFGLVAVGRFNGALEVFNSETTEELCRVNTSDDNHATSILNFIRITTEIPESSAYCTWQFQGIPRVHPRILVCSNRKTLQEFDINGREVWKVSANVCVNHVAVSPANRAMCLATDSMDLQIIDHRHHRSMLTLRGHLDCCFSADFNLQAPHILATSALDETCRVWDLRSPKRALHVIGNCITPVCAVQYSNDGQYLLVAESEDYIHVLRHDDDYRQKQTLEFYGSVTGASFSPDGSQLFVGAMARHGGKLLQFSRMSR
eukprot:Polyplicarium_translucidae@DN3123_c0_g1_i2.p1